MEDGSSGEFIAEAEDALLGSRGWWVEQICMCAASTLFFTLNALSSACSRREGYRTVLLAPSDLKTIE